MPLLPVPRGGTAPVHVVMQLHRSYGGNADYFRVVVFPPCALFFLLFFYYYFVIVKTKISLSSPFDEAGLVKKGSQFL